MGHCFLLSCMFVTLFQQCCKGFQVKGSTQPIAALVGDDVILPCHLEPQTNAVAMTIEWSRPDLHPRYVHIHRNGQELIDEKNPSYLGRTALFKENMKTGNISLKLSRVKISDEGSYKCLTPTYSLVKQAEIHLSVYSVSEPVITNHGPKDGGVVLQCETRSKVSEPVVKWMEKDGPEILNSDTEIIPDPDGLYNVTNKVTVDETASNTFICSVESREKEITIPGSYFTGHFVGKPDDGSNQTGHRRVGLVLLVLLGCWCCWG